MNFHSQIFFNDINHGYRVAILKKTSLWLLPFCMVLTTYFYYEKVLRTMRTAIISNLLNWLKRITTHILLNISRIKGNQTMKFGQLIEHPKRNIFL